MSKNKDFLLQASPFRVMLKLALPAMIGMIVIGLYPVMDGIFAGRILGEASMTAVGIAVPFTYINNGISTLIGVGSASVLSRALGEKNQKTINKIMGNLMLWILLLSSVVTILGFLFCRYLLIAMGAGGEILNLATRYLRIVFLGSVFVNFAQAANMVMRGEGLMIRAMLIMALGAVINIVLDPILMTAMGEQGIEGAAIATVSAQIIQAGVTLYFFKYKSVAARIGHIRIAGELSKSMFAVGVSAMLMQILAIIQMSFLYNQAFRYGGDSAAAVMAVSMRIMGFSFLPLWGMSQGLQPAVGTNYGAKQYTRMKAFLRLFALGSILVAAVFWLPAEIFAEPLLRLFGLAEETITPGVPSFRIVYSTLIFYGVMIMILTFFQAIGDGKTAGLLVLLRQVFLFIPVLLFLTHFFGIRGLWFSVPLVDGTVIILSILLYTKAARKYKDAAPSPLPEPHC